MDLLTIKKSKDKYRPKEPLVSKTILKLIPAVSLDKITVTGNALRSPSFLPFVSLGLVLCLVKVIRAYFIFNDLHAVHSTEPFLWDRLCSLFLAARVTVKKFFRYLPFLLSSLSFTH